MKEIKEEILKNFVGVKVLEIDSLLNKLFAKGITEGRRREKVSQTKLLNQDNVINHECQVKP